MTTITAPMPATISTSMTSRSVSTSRKLSSMFDIAGSTRTNGGTAHFARRTRPSRPPDPRLPAGPEDERVEAVPAGDRTCAPIDGRDRRGGAEPVRGQLGDEIGQHLVEIDGELRGLDPVHPFVEFGNCDP